MGSLPLAPGGSDGKASACNAGYPGSIPRLGRSPGEGNGNPLQYSCLENSMDGGAWWATVHGVVKSRTRMSDFTSLPPSVQFSCSVVSDSLRPHGLQHAWLPVRHHLPELAQTHVHRVSDAIQSSHPLLSPSPPAFNLSQHPGLFQ